MTQLILALLLSLPTLAYPLAPATPLTSLPPHLATLYAAYPTLHQPLGNYAEQQGFRGNYERLSTIIHELIHIDSAAKNGYLIYGNTYAPYNKKTSWPAYRFSDYRATITRSPTPLSQDLTHTPVYQLYITNAPDNTLSSLADELNAYSQTTRWLCQTIQAAPNPSETDQRSRSVQSMKDMLRITNHYLATLHTQESTQYNTLYTHQKPARNLLALTALNALDSLQQCGNQLPASERNELDTLIQTAERQAAHK